jgi:hypothetical protein
LVTIETWKITHLHPSFEGVEKARSIKEEGRMKNAGIRVIRVIRVSSGPGMKFPMDFAEAISGHVRVNLGGADAGVAEQFLDDAQVRAPLPTCDICLRCRR